MASRSDCFLRHWPAGRMVFLRSDFFFDADCYDLLWFYSFWCCASFKNGFFWRWSACRQVGLIAFVPAGLRLSMIFWLSGMSPLAKGGAWDFASGRGIDAYVFNPPAYTPANTLPLRQGGRLRVRIVFLDADCSDLLWFYSFRCCASSKNFFIRRWLALIFYSNIFLRKILE